PDLPHHLLDHAHDRPAFQPHRPHAHDAPRHNARTTRRARVAGRDAPYAPAAAHRRSARARAVGFHRGRHSRLVRSRVLRLRDRPAPHLTGPHPLRHTALHWTG